MTPHYLAHVIHILESIDRILLYAEQKRSDPDPHGALYDAILRRLQTLSESASKLPDEIKADHPHIRWKEIAGFRNILVHNYLGEIDSVIVDKVVSDHLPDLRVSMLQYVPDWKG